MRCALHDTLHFLASCPFYDPISKLYFGKEFLESQEIYEYLNRKTAVSFTIF